MKAVFIALARPLKGEGIAERLESQLRDKLGLDEGDKVIVSDPSVTLSIMHTGQVTIIEFDELDGLDSLDSVEELGVDSAEETGDK
jgi:hypothetical protein